MAIQQINMNNVNEVKFNGQDVKRIQLNNNQIWKGKTWQVVSTATLTWNNYAVGAVSKDFSVPEFGDTFRILITNLRVEEGYDSALPTFTLVSASAPVYLESGSVLRLDYRSIQTFTCVVSVAKINSTTLRVSVTFEGYNANYNEMLMNLTISQLEEKK